MVKLDNCHHLIYCFQITVNHQYFDMKFADPVISQRKLLNKEKQNMLKPGEEFLDQHPPQK